MTLKRKLRIFRVTVHEARNGKHSRIAVALDLLYCKVRFHVTEDEYLKYNFYNLQDRYRKNFLLVYHQKKFGNISARFFTRSKYLFYKRIPDLYSRGMLLAPHCGEEAFLEFVRKYPKIIVKPDLGSLGKGIELFQYTDDDAAKDFFKKFSMDVPMICEEFVKQHKDMDAFHPYSVNTVRVVTILDDGKVEVVGAAMKTGGAADKFVDNMHSGGIGAQVDVETGLLTTFGRDYQFKRFSHHPITGVQFVGFQIPNWDKVINLATQAHKRLPQCLIFGWDIAITEDGAEIIEANNAPGPKLIQTMDQIPKGRKIIKMLKTIRVPQQYPKNHVYHPDYGFGEKTAD